MTTFELLDNNGRILDTVNYTSPIQFELIGNELYCTLDPPVKFTVKGKIFGKNRVSKINVSGLPNPILLDKELFIRSQDIFIFDYLKLNISKE